MELEEQTGEEIKGSAEIDYPSPKSSPGPLKKPIDEEGKLTNDVHVRVIGRHSCQQVPHHKSTISNVYESLGVRLYQLLKELSKDPTLK